MSATFSMNSLKTASPSIITEYSVCDAEGYIVRRPVVHYVLNLNVVATVDGQDTVEVVHVTVTLFKNLVNVF